MKPTRRIRILRALKAARAGLSLVALCRVMDETGDSARNAVSWQLQLLISEKLVVADAVRRGRVFQITSFGFEELQSVELGIKSMYRRGAQRRSRPCAGQIVIRSQARAGDAPVGAISSVFDLGRLA